MIRPIALAALALGLAAPALADDVPPDLAESRLRGCLLAGATSPGQTQLAAKVIEVRAFCGAQIKRVREHRMAAAAGPDAKAAVARKLDAEIAHAVANFSGFSS
ncbi:hypothetical protein A6F68_00526 [Tsuneonella dongtanensis]|uniref:Uncharacterized protein n=1 Tax=Tsuneonella dongtanensis TaxID=692370 RepID=A0A1B2AAD2_9SPHN|nr:hypothetical protein [Tsuneonella dongtanensis]ANY19061.1 hypothetical protein A6F68_00526 [Tsuneonella dongtanensis]